MRILLRSGSREKHNVGGFVNSLYSHVGVCVVDVAIKIGRLFVSKWHEGINVALIMYL